MKQPAVYIMASARNGTLYTGVTSNLPKRAFEHREGAVPGFTSQYGCKMLVWYELHGTMVDAIAKQSRVSRKVWIASSASPPRNDAEAYCLRYRCDSDTCVPGAAQHEARSAE